MPIAKEKEKPVTQLAVKIETKLYDKLKTAAAKMRRTVTAQLEEVLENWQP